MITLQKGAVYKSRHNGAVEYIGRDRFYGETTHKFRRLNYGGTSYVLPEELDDFLEPKETLESVKQQRDELVSVLESTRDRLSWYQGAFPDVANSVDAWLMERACTLIDRVKSSGGAA